MNNSPIYHALNRLLSILQRSFPMYLRCAPPLAAETDSEAVDLLNQIAEDQTSLSRRITGLLLSSGDQPDAGDFPMEFTDMHDLGIDYLVNAAIAYQQQDIETIGQLVERLQAAPAAKSLAEEALGMAKGHLETLRELVAAEVK